MGTNQLRAPPGTPGLFRVFSPRGLVHLLTIDHTIGLKSFHFYQIQWWSGGAMVLGKLPVPGRPTIWMIVAQGHTALAVGAGWGCLDILLSSIFSKGR